MDQFEIEHFNRASTVTVGDKVRINNLIANARLSCVTLTKESATLVFSTMKKLKPPIVMTFVIPCEHLTDQQLSELLVITNNQK